MLAILADGRRDRRRHRQRRRALASPGSRTVSTRSTPGRRTCAPAPGPTTVGRRRRHGRDHLVPGEVASAGLTSQAPEPRRDRRRRHQPERPRQQRGLQLHREDRDRRRASAPVSGAMSSERPLRLRRQPACSSRAAAAAAPTSRRASQGGVPLLQWLVIPARTGFLKEFFEISMVVQNLASGRSSRCATAPPRSTCPPGLSLAPTARAAVGERRAPGHPGRRRRGDALGRARRQRGRLRAARPLLRHARPDRPAGRARGAARRPDPRLRRVGDEDRGRHRRPFDDRYPGHVRVGIRNVSPATITNAALQIPIEGAQGYVAQPRQQRSWTAASIAPGETWFPDYGRATPTTTSSSSPSRPAP